MSETGNLYWAATRAFDRLSARGLRAAYPRLAFLSVLLTEFRRAIAAERRYEQLKGASAALSRNAPCDVPRRIFEEFYFLAGTAASGVSATGVAPIPARPYGDGDTQ